MSPVDAILVSGDPRLRAPAAPVGGAPAPAEVARVTAALAAARARHGFGRALAAPQIGLGRRLIALDLGAGPFAIADPEITWRSEDQVLVWDDCFSVPDVVAQVARHRSISLRYRDERGRVRSWERLSPELAELVQHELDHLDGVLMTDRARPDAIAPAARRGELVDAARPRPRLRLAEIARAAQAIDPVFTRSPLIELEPLAEAAGCALALKVETLNPIRSFKGRGADWFVAQAGGGPFVCASAGNFGQAMAYACRARGIALTVFAATTANPLKVARMRALGAEVLAAGDDVDAAGDAAQAWAAARGIRFVEDGREPAISEGAGTIAVELPRDLDAIAIPIGAGALITGMARWLRAAAPATQVIGVVSEGAAAMQRSWRAGRAIAEDHVRTIADGIAVRAPIDVVVADVRGLVDDVVAVADDALIGALRRLHADAGLVAEPAGVAGLAAILADRARFAGARVATVITGSNVTPDALRAWL